MDVNTGFKSACKILLGQETGELADFEVFLSRYSGRARTLKSMVSGNAVAVSEDYGKNSALVSYCETSRLPSKPFNINEIKDIDSLLEAACERFAYSGDKILGKSSEVVQSDSVIDSMFVKSSREIYASEFVAYSQMVDGSKHMYGCSWGTLSSFCINATEFFKSTRIFESGLIICSGDISFSYNCNNCSNLMFCFNQRSKRYAIGNCQLEPGKFNSLKSKLLCEVALHMQKNKTFPSVCQIASGGYQNGQN